MVKQEYIEKVNEALAEEFEVSIERISPGADIRATLNLDSMKAMQVVVIVKRYTGIVIYPRQFPRFTTFQTLYDYIAERTQLTQ